MKIAAIHSFLNIKAGAQLAFLNMMMSLRNRGHEIDIYLLGISGELRKELQNYFEITSLNFKEWRFSYMGFFLMLVNRFRAMRQFRRLADEINRGDYDLAFIDHSDYSPLILPYLKIPKVYYCYEPPRRYYEPVYSYMPKEQVCTKIYLLNRVAPFIPDIIDKELDRCCVRFADLILCPSDYSREYTWRTYGMFPVTNYLGVDLEKCKRLSCRRENLVVSVGVLFQSKCHDFTIRSIGLIPKDKRPKLIIIASRATGGEKERLLNLAKFTGVDLEIKGYVPDEEFAELHSRAKVVAIAYVMEPSIEPVALAFETPIVAVREGGARETIIHNETGILTSREEKEFAHAIEYLLDNPDVAEEMGKKGRKWIEKNFTWDKCTENLEKNLKRVSTKQQKVRDNEMLTAPCDE